MTRFKEVTGGGEIITSKSLEGGEVFEGTYKGSKEGQFDNLLHTLVLNEGKTITLAGCAALDYKLACCGDDSLVRLTYLGKAPLQGGKRAGTLAHQWAVELGEPEGEMIPF